MRNLARLASRLYNSPLLIVPEKADVFDGVFRSALDGRFEQKAELDVAPQDLMLAGQPTFMRQRGGYMRSDNGIALIQVFGPLVQRAASGIDAISGAFESYQNLSAQLSAAMNDPMVRGILLEFDSPGGEVNGVVELGNAIRTANDTKPVMAHANEGAFSAAYWLASSAGEIMAPTTGMVGSVGVIMLHVDQSQLNAKRGLDVTHITFGAKKADFSPHQPLSERAMSDAQAMVDRIGNQFVDHVASMRGIDAQVVRDTEAGLLNPDQAIAAGMLDHVGTLANAAARLDTMMRDPMRKRGYGQRAAASADLSQENDTMAGNAASTAAPEVNAAEQLAKARSEGLAEGVTQGKAEGVKEGAAGERTRIAAILTHAEATDRRAMAEHLAFKTSNSVDESVALLSSAPKQAAAPTNLLDAAMRKVANADVGVQTSAAADLPLKPRKTSAEIFEARRSQVQAIK